MKRKRILYILITVFQKKSIKILVILIEEAMKKLSVVFLKKI